MRARPGLVGSVWVVMDQFAAPKLSATVYDAVFAPLEHLGMRAARAELLTQARGRVLEVGAGTGLSLPHYPPAVTSVVAYEPDPGLRTRLDRRAAAAPVPVRVVAGGIPGLDLADGSIDTVVCVFVLCTVGDVDAGLADLRRVLARDGSLLFLEHVLGRRPVAGLQRLVTPAWSHLAGGCHLDRDTIGALRSAGFVITDLDRLAPLGRLTAGSVVRGRAMARLATPSPTIDPPGGT